MRRYGLWASLVEQSKWTELSGDLYLSIETIHLMADCIDWNALVWTS